MKSPPWLVALAAVGGSILLVVAVTRWGAPQDEHSYWLGAERLLRGEPLYDMTVTNTTPYAYRYPPVFAQALVPVVAIVPFALFGLLWTAAMLAALWWLGGRNPLVALALVAFPPVATEFWFRNVHLFLAVLLVWGLRGWPGWFAVGAGIKIAPGLAVPYLAAAGLWRRLGVVVVVGVAMLVVSVALSPGAWAQYWEFLWARGPMDTSSFVPIPFLYRAVVAVVLAVIAGRLRPRLGEPLFVVAFVIGLPSLWFTGLSALVAVVPLVRSPAAGPDRAISYVAPEATRLRA